MWAKMIRDAGAFVSNEIANGINALAARIEQPDYTSDFSKMAFELDEEVMGGDLVFPERKVGLLVGEDASLRNWSSVFQKCERIRIYAEVFCYTRAHELASSLSAQSSEKILAADRR